MVAAAAVGVRTAARSHARRPPAHVASLAPGVPRRVPRRRRRISRTTCSHIACTTAAVAAAAAAAGFNVETVEYKSLSFTVWDVGGQTKLRPLWRHYYHGSRGLIFLVDSNDTRRMAEAEETLAAILEDDELRGVPVLVLANKQDLPRAMAPAAVADKLGMSKLRGRQWHVQGCNALSGDGVYEGMDWLAAALKAEKRAGR